jgi:hypothetical protein
MNNNSHPIETIIDFAWASGADRFWVNNAKDELKKLRAENEKLKRFFEHPIAFARINDRFDLYDLNIQNNPFNDQSKVVPLYSNREEFLKGDWKGYHYGKSPE